MFDQLSSRKQKINKKSKGNLAARAGNPAFTFLVFLRNLFVRHLAPTHAKDQLRNIM